MGQIYTYQTLKQRDPSRTTALRNAFSRELRKRFKALRLLIWQVIVEDDVFGLINSSDRTVTTLKVYRRPGRRRFAFPRSADKVSAFMKWLQEQIDNDIIQVTRIDQIGQGVENAWTNVFIQDSYRRGVTRARGQLQGIGLSLPAGLGGAFTNPFHIDRLGLLYTRAFNELQGITNDMGKMISKILTQGMADGLNPRTIAKQINRVISGSGAELGFKDSLGRYVSAETRADMLARTEVIRAHAEAQLQEYKNWGVEGVSIKVEFITAGDVKVCKICQRYEKSVFTLTEASGMIPLHPRCRCIWLPYDEAFAAKMKKKK
jgi:phage putative head morphogenesis protein, SPP1 gp7 family